jgi:hypothetical protein
MDEANEPKKLTPPYISFKTLLNFLDQLRVGIPHRIDHTVMGKFSGTARTQILTTLKYLQLVNPDDTATEMLQKLVRPDGIDKKYLREIIIAAYPFVFKNGVELSRMSLGHLKELFEAAGASGGTTRKSIAFFVAAAKEIGMELYPRLKMTGLSRSTGKKVKKPAMAKTDRHDDTPDEGTQGQKIVTVPSWQQILKEKFPPFDPTWTPEVQKNWFEGFNKLMDQFQKTEQQKKGGDDNE